MSDEVRTGQMPYNQSRLLLLAGGLIALGVVAGIMLVRGIDTVEVWAAVLFMPVFAGFMFGGVAGGIVAGGIASAAYAGLRAPAIDAVGFDSFAGLIISRSVAYVLFGGIGGYANRQLEASLTKLDLYDQIDDATGLNNARSFVIDVDLEMARARRYQTFFSLVIVDIPAETIHGLGRRKRAAILKELGRMLREAVRSMDHPVHAYDGSNHRIGVILPETGLEGAQVFGNRLAESLKDFLSGRAIEVSAVRLSVAAFPADDDGPVSRLRNEFAAIDAVEHPESAVSA